MSLSPGQEVAGKFRVERVLGAGGMGIVVAARHQELNRLFALKVMHPEKHGDPDLIQRFLREARAAGRLHGLHVARVTDVDRMPDGTPFLVMEYLQGEDLRRRLARAPALSIEEAVDCAIQVCDALAEAHAAGIVHRDLKPENLFLSEGPHGVAVKVLDFGISKITEPEAADEGSLTGVRVAIGSGRYMSPEQMRSSRDVDPRTDIWSLGVTLYELLAGTAPFHGESFSVLSAAVLRDDPPSLRSHRRGVPRDLEAVVLRCLRKDPSERFGDAPELARALAPFASDAGRELASRIAQAAPHPAMQRTPPPDTAAALEPVSSALDETAVSKDRAGLVTDGSAEIAAPSEPERRAGARNKAAILAVVAGAAAAAAVALWSGANTGDPGAGGVRTTGAVVDGPATASSPDAPGTKTETATLPATEPAPARTDAVGLGSARPEPTGQNAAARPAGTGSPRRPAPAAPAAAPMSAAAIPPATTSAQPGAAPAPTSAASSTAATAGPLVPPPVPSPTTPPSSKTREGLF